MISLVPYTDFEKPKTEILEEFEVPSADALDLAVKQDEIGIAANEPQLIKEAKAGDIQAYSSVFEFHRPRIQVTVGWSPHAQDVVQTTYIKGWNAIESLPESYATAGPWLAKIGYNYAVDLWRTEQRRQKIASTINCDVSELDQVTLKEKNPLPAIDEELLAREGVKAILALVTKHGNAEMARMIAHVFLGGESITDYAKQNQLNLQTAKTRLLRLRKKLAALPPSARSDIGL